MLGAFIIGTKALQIQIDFKECVDVLKIELKKRNVVLLQLEPLEPAPGLQSGLGIEEQQSPIMLLLRGSGNRVYKEFLTPYNRIIDLAPSEDEIFDQMREKGRYHIKLAIKRGVTIKAVDPTRENLDIWMWLLEQTVARDGFSGNSRSYYEVFLTEVSRQYGNGLYFGYAENERVVTAGIFVFTPERAIYYYGASSSDPEDRKKMGSYLLQWCAIQDAKKKGSQYYDFLWVADPNNPHDHLKGVSDFKEKFWGYRVQLPPKLCISLSFMGRCVLLLKTMFRS